ncbi:hypothetical protein [Longimicrobium sp.]|uniref:hypothetical protein n=1 Tax=Longimicrobium sp. TaxID=2029185 RepID=UPI002B5D971B|nr:hypothetical protein [Longimicrobium sp.]HSU12622.1 hypothetical protein [Longimicrobium sp.]
MTRAFMGRARPLAAAALVALLAACGGDGNGGDAKDGKDAKAADPAGQKGAQAQQPAQPRAAPAKTSWGKTAAESQQCFNRLQARLDSAAAALKADSAAKNPGAGRNPVFAKEQGWYPKKGEFRDGDLLPCSRIVAYYGNPSSTRMGALGEFPRDEMLRRLQGEVRRWSEADPSTPVIPALHLIAVVAQGAPGPSGHYRAQMRDQAVDSIYQMARSINAIMLIDVQVGTDDVRNIMPRFEEFLKRPDVHFAVDPEFYMRGGIVPGRKIGTMYAADINWVTDQLARIVRENNLPPKVLVIHRFTRNMVPDAEKIQLRPEVELVMDMDGWGAPWLKHDSYQDYIVRHPVEFTGFKLFYHNDTKKGDPLMTPRDVLNLWPQPLYIQYQ